LFAQVPEQHSPLAMQPWPLGRQVLTALAQMLPVQRFEQHWLASAHGTPSGTHPGASSGGSAESGNEMTDESNGGGTTDESSGGVMTDESTAESGWPAASGSPPPPVSPASPTGAMAPPHAVPADKRSASNPAYRIVVMLPCFRGPSHRALAPRS
jgi:hypothetical protein